jgi:hypothetical protein
MNNQLRLRILSAIDQDRLTAGYILVETNEADPDLQGPLLGVFEVTYSSGEGCSMRKLDGNEPSIDEIIRYVRAVNRPSLAAAPDPEGAIARIPFDECRRVAELVATYARAFHSLGGIDGETVNVLVREYAAHEWNRRHMAGRF